VTCIMPGIARGNDSLGGFFNDILGSRLAVTPNQTFYCAYLVRDAFAWRSSPVAIS